MYIEQLCDLVEESNLPVSEKNNLKKLVIKGACQYLYLRKTNMEKDELNFILTDCFIEQSDFLNSLGIKVFPKKYGEINDKESFFGQYFQKCDTFVIFPLSLFSKDSKFEMQEKIKSHKK